MPIFLYAIEIPWSDPDQSKNNHWRLPQLQLPNEKAAFLRKGTAAGYVLFKATYLN